MTGLERWERRCEVPLILLALAFLVAYAWPLLDPGISPRLVEILTAVSWTVYAAFAIDLAGRLILADNRGEYALRHWYDFVLIAVPLLRPLRLLRLLALARVIQRSIGGTIASRAVVYVGGVAVTSLFLGSLAILDAERGAKGANITTFGDALWWTTTTVTTVGYGDHFPVTTEGRVVATLLMLVGIAMIGTATASVASWFLARTESDREARNAK